MLTMHNYATALILSGCKEDMSPGTKHQCNSQPTYQPSHRWLIFEVYLHFRNQSCLKFNDNDSLKEILYVFVLIFFFNVAEVKIWSYINSCFSVFQMGNKSEYNREVLSWSKSAHTQMK